jgi:hypothetical protein
MEWLSRFDSGIKLPLILLTIPSHPIPSHTIHRISTTFTERILFQVQLTRIRSSVKLCFLLFWLTDSWISGGVKIALIRVVT